MKLIHTSDIHLGSPMTAKLPSSKVTARRRELFRNMLRLTEEAKRIGAMGIIIAGDLFDSQRITPRELDSLMSVINGSPELAFFYLPGNHEGDALSRAGADAVNLFTFGESWTSFELSGVTVTGRSESAPDMFGTLRLDANKTNIAVLHGEICDRSAEGGKIGLTEAAGKNIDYLALGHYHTYSAQQIDRRGVAVYSGSPEGRGFDETGDMGYVLIDITDGEVSHRFVSFAGRRHLELDADITGALSTTEVEARIKPALAAASPSDLVRVRLVGGRELMLRCDTDYLTEKLGADFYYFEIKDKSTLTTRAEDFMYDKSLRGEFIRLALADKSLTDSERERIIHCGLSALAGEAFDT